jgi:hypothetical protein
MRYSYDAKGRLLTTTSGVEGQASTETTYVYDQQGRLQSISSGGRPDSPTTFNYDERGRKRKTQTSSPADYRPNTAIAGPPFEAADRAPNLPGGGSATTIYDEYDRAIEVQVRDAQGELVSRAVRTYDTQGHLVEEKQVLDNPETLFPAEARAKMLEQSGLSREEFQQALRTKLTELMAGRSEPYSAAYSYDTHGRLSHTNRRIFNEEEKIETTYNEHGDAASEITRSVRLTGDPDPSTPTPGLPSYSEVRHTYQYDQHGNWVEQSSSYRSDPDGAFQPPTVIKRTLTYY